MGLGSHSSLMELYLQHFVKIKCQHHSSVVNSTDTNRDINIHRPKTYPWSPCLHYSETFAWKGTNWVKSSGSLSTHYKSSSWKMSIYLSTNCVYHSIRKHMDETKGLVLHQDTWHCWNHHLPKSTVWSHIIYIPLIYVTKNCACGWR